MEACLLSQSDNSNSLAALQGCIKSQHCLSVGVASPPVQCSNTGLEKRNQKSQTLMQPSNAPNCWSRHSDLTGLTHTHTHTHTHTPGFSAVQDDVLGSSPSDAAQASDAAARESVVMEHVAHDAELVEDWNLAFLPQSQINQRGLFQVQQSTSKLSTLYSVLSVVIPCNQRRLDQLTSSIVDRNHPKLTVKTVNYRRS